MSIAIYARSRQRQLSSVSLDVMNTRWVVIAISSAGLAPTHSALAHESEGEYFGLREPQTQAMADRLRANALGSPKRFEDISLLMTWFIGSCLSGDHVFHFRA